MRALIQRVKNAKVEVKNQIVGQINSGLLIFLGVHHNDTTENIDYLVKKISNLRIFEDENNKMNLSVKDINGSVLIISQFTLYADTRRGNRPDFINAAKPDKAKEFYQNFIEKFQTTGIHTQTGIFAADMQVSLTNDGPVTIQIET